ncbi:MAG: FTR1 family protein [Nitrospinota bacterium]
MTAGLLVTFREGLEAFLVVGIILSYLGRADLNGYKRWIYAASLLGLVSAFVLGLIFQLTYTGFESGIGRLYFKLVIMGFAVAVLSYMILWMSRNSRNIKGEVEQAVESAVTTGSMVTISLLAYVAILREGFETVLFLGAIFGDEMSTPVLYGGVLGLVIALAVTIGFFKGMRSLSLRLFFKMTGVLILLIAAGLLTNMVGIMQEAQLLPVFKESLFDISRFISASSEPGMLLKALFGYTPAPSLLQALSYATYFVFAISILYRTGEKERRKGRVNEAATV